VANDLPGAHAPRVHRYDLVVEAGKPALVLGNELRIEGRLPIPRDLQLDPAGLGRDRLAAIAVPAVAGLLGGQMMLHLGVQRPLGQRLLQVIEPAIGIEGRLRVRASQQLIQQRVGNTGCLASGHRGSPSVPS
jgi:hypothetical protein